LLLADEIVLDNDTRLTGTVTGLAGDVLTLTSDYAEPIKIKKEHITRISTDNPVELHLASGEIIKGKLKTGDDGLIVVDQGDSRAATGIDLKSIAAINPPPAGKWQGNVTLAGSLETGNTDKSGLSFGADAMRRGDTDRFNMRFLYNIAEEDDKMDTRNVFGALQYDYFFTKKHYAYLAAELFHDTFKDLNLRTIVGPGVGYQVWEEPDKALSLEAGISFFNLDLKDQEDQSWLTARLAANCRYKLTKSLVFTDRLVLYPSLEDANDFVLRNEAALLTAVGADWSLKLADVLEYVNNPAEGRKSTDSTLTVGLQYAF
jgi:putative salt-induced outer membrane protein YdiY